MTNSARREDDLWDRIERLERARAAAAQTRAEEAQSAAERAAIARHLRVESARAEKDGKSRVEPSIERLAKNDEHDWIDPSRIDSNQPMNGLVRRFKSAHLDRLYKPDKPNRSPLDFRQWYAGDKYRNDYQRAGITLSVTANYGERTSQGEQSYGLAKTEGQAIARDRWRQARLSMPRALVGFMDRFLLHDEMPRYGGRRAMKSMDEIRYALDCLADHYRINRGTDWQLAR